MAARIVGENSMGIRLAWRSFQAVIKRSASSSTCVGRAPSRSFILRGPVTLILWLATIKTHFACRLNAMHNVI
jgi:hypothetical protein